MFPELCRCWHKSGDITKLPGPTKGKHFDVYDMSDISSRDPRAKVHPAGHG